MSALKTGGAGRSGANVTLVKVHDGTKLQGCCRCDTKSRAHLCTITATVCVHHSVKVPTCTNLKTAHAFKFTPVNMRQDPDRMEAQQHVTTESRA